jgi:non-heme chloroperoxidase
MQAGHKNTLDCIKAFSETDFTEDLEKFDVPTLILHGDDDQVVPIESSALRSSKLVKNAKLVVYLPWRSARTHRDAQREAQRRPPRFSQGLSASQAEVKGTFVES